MKPKIDRKRRRIELGDLAVTLVWFDSFGAKSSSVLVETPDVKVLIDCGVAVMHPSFPAPSEAKWRWVEEGYAEIKKAARKADIVVISHYHYDHFTDFDRELYEDKLVLAKNPNEYINNSQRARALSFFRHLYEELGGLSLEEVMEEPAGGEYGDPMEDLPIASTRDFGDYGERRRQLLEKGMKWFLRRAEKWRKYRRIPELSLDRVSVKFPEGCELRFGATTLRFTKPMFHGIEFSRVGWVFATLIEHGGWKLIHSSDLNGPIIEDYAAWIARENPDLLVLDGPMTYMLGYTLNLINLGRAVENAITILKESEVKLVVYDHHLPREPRFRERTVKVWKTAEKLGKTLATAAEVAGLKPAVLLYGK